MSNLFLDDIARAMTDVEPPIDLRARVLSEIGRQDARRWSAVALPLALAASIAAVAVVAVRPLLTEIEMPAVPRPSLVQLAATDPAPLTIPGSAGATARRSGAPVSADELAWLSRRLPALETRALTLEPIQPPPPSIAPISVEPIALEPISVPPPGAGSGDRR
ncbi:MAG TPA: hypothetical protein VMS54_04195 [Vicinamibacterales bacterium]|nr:hypothetical protein [Vicinamibacterales bacterium]